MVRFYNNLQDRGDCKLRGNRTRRRMLWVGLWVGNLPENELERRFVQAEFSPNNGLAHRRRSTTEALGTKQREAEGVGILSPTDNA
jgi:hypothetical protein